MDIENIFNQSNLKQDVPLRLSPDAIKELQTIYYNEFRVIISPPEANMLGLRLLRLFTAIYKPIKKNGYAK